MNEDSVILVVDDERDHADGIAESLENHCAKAIAVYNGKDALEIVRTEKVDIVITDLKLGDNIDGLDVLNDAKKHNPATEVVLITAYASIETCKDAIKRGAYDYLVKPIDIDQLRNVVKQICRKQPFKKAEPINNKKIITEQFIFEGIRGSDKAVNGIFEVLRRVAKTNISVLIEGDSGTGKELLARAVHKNSNRANKPFMPINCAGLSESLLESELFGHVKGAFTGAATDRKGLFELSDKGTLFLDEIGDMPMNMQAKLLRVLEDGVVVPVGGHKPVVVDVRIISATNRDLTKIIEDNKFRQDLYFRIKGVSVTLPNLAQRTQDIPELVHYFIEEAADEIGSNVKGITDTALMILCNHSWPGNIRQLRNCVKIMVVMCDREKIDVQDLPPEIHQQRPLLTAGARVGGDLGGVPLNELEKQAIIDTLARTENNREKAAKILGIGERTLYRKIKEYNL